MGDNLVPNGLSMGEMAVEWGQAGKHLLGSIAAVMSVAQPDRSRRDAGLCNESLSGSNGTDEVPNL
jgi:hypothetical protein